MPDPEMPAPKSSTERGDEWMFLFHENLLLTVQAIHQLHMALDEKLTS